MRVTTVDDALSLVDERLQEVVITQIDVLQETSGHILTAGGKKVRPRLVFLAYLAAGGKDLNEAVSLAAAVELVHTATLVHDDINDHSLTRRGKVSVHAKWGRTFALLTGDYLFTKVYELMAPYGKTLNQIMAEACVRLVEGETLQAAAAKSGDIDRKTYKQIIALKTASLFQAAGRMGALLAQSGDQIEQALSHFGYNLGMAFQIVDDVLDVVGDEKVMGKPVGNDLAQGAGAILAQNGRRITATVERLESEQDPIVALMARLRDSGAVDAALVQASEMANRARHALLDLPPSNSRDELEKLVDLVIQRQR